jgi:hypothetical protein
VCGHDDRAEEIDERIDHLMAVFVADDTDRLERLTSPLSSDFVYVSPEGGLRGRLRPERGVRPTPKGPSPGW